MKTAGCCALSLILIAPLMSAEEPLKRYLYMSSSDGAQLEGVAEAGVYVFDIGAGHRFVKHIPVEGFAVGMRGFTGCTKTGRP